MEAHVCKKNCFCVWILTLVSSYQIWYCIWNQFYTIRLSKCIFLQPEVCWLSRSVGSWNCCWHLHCSGCISTAGELNPGCWWRRWSSADPAVGEGKAAGKSLVRNKEIERSSGLATFCLYESHLDFGSRLLSQSRLTEHQPGGRVCVSIPGEHGRRRDRCKICFQSSSQLPGSSSITSLPPSHPLLHHVPFPQELECYKGLVGNFQIHAKGSQDFVYNFGFQFCGK